MASQIDADCCRPNDSEPFDAQSQTDPVAPLPPIFEFERQGTTLIVTPVADLRELDYPQIEAGKRDAASPQKRHHRKRCHRLSQDRLLRFHSIGVFRMRMEENKKP